MEPFRNQLELMLSVQLKSYSSLTLSYMAQAVGVTDKYIDKELSKYIAGGRLHAKLDKVSK